MEKVRQVVHSIGYHPCLELGLGMEGDALHLHGLAFHLDLKLREFGFDQCNSHFQQRGWGGCSPYRGDRAGSRWWGRSWPWGHALGPCPVRPIQFGGVAGGPSGKTVADPEGPARASRACTFRLQFTDAFNQEVTR